MRSSEGRLETTLSRGLGARLLVSMADRPAAERDLSPAEDLRWRSLRGTLREEAWLRGRAALKSLLARLAADPDTGGIAFPHRWLSLSHAGKRAVAVAVLDPEARGVGIDLEAARSVPEGAGRFFLGPGERAVVAGLDDPGRQSLRLWTVKEAVFKADLDNRGRVLAEYVIDDPRRAAGLARRGGQAWRFSSLAFGAGFLTAAVATGGTHVE